MSNVVRWLVDFTPSEDYASLFSQKKRKEKKTHPISMRLYHSF
jgi:hypothetical protein